MSFSPNRVVNASKSINGTLTRVIYNTDKQKFNELVLNQEERGWKKAEEVYKKNGYYCVKMTFTREDSHEPRKAI